MFDLFNQVFFGGLLKGVKIPFIDNKMPRQHKIPCELNMSEEEMTFVDSHLLELLEEGFIIKLDAMIPNGWVSNIFLVPKCQGGFLMILNLKELNKFIQYTMFKMDHIDKVVNLLHLFDFMGLLDLPSAYGQVHLDTRYQKFFQFTWRGVFYCYVTLPQGFSDSPRMFVRITSPLMAYLQDRLVDILIYIDNMFLHASNSAELSMNLAKTLDLFDKCGLLVNKQKSCIVPTQQMEFLGFLFDSIEYTSSVTDDKHQALLNLITKIYSDASGFGYGSTWNGVEVQGLFTEKQKLLSINTKELLAIYYALGAHAEKLSNEVVLV